MSTINVKIREAYDTEANWKSKNPVLLSGQLAYSSDKYGKYKIGDGTKTWSQLSYVTVSWDDISGRPGSIAPSAHNHDDRYYTETEINEKLGGKANASDLTSHTGNTTVHITSTERTNWNSAKTHASSAHAPSNAQVNQNAFSNVLVGSTTIAADVPTDTLTMVAGANVQITPDAANDKITISATDTKYTHPTSHPASIITQDSTHRFVSDTDKNNWNSKANANHTHNYAGSSSVGGSANSAVKLATARTINGVAFDGTTNIEVPNNFTKALTTEDLNNVIALGEYYAGGGNTVKNKPSGVQHFGMKVYKTASGYTAQKLHGSDNVIYYRIHDNSSFGAWQKIYSTTSKPTASEIGAAPSGHTHTPAQVGLGNVNNTADNQKSVKYATSAGSATTASKLGSSSVGSATQPMFLNSGTPTACTYTLGKSVPSNAVFTDTVYTHPTNHPATVITQDSTHRFVTDSEKSTWNSKANGSHKHNDSDINSISASKITGTINIQNLPQGALERCVVVADDTARFKLTTAQAQKGDTVKVTSTGKMYFVMDDTKLNSEAGYEIYTAGTASTVPWSGVLNKPSTFPPSTHNHDNLYYTESEMNAKLAEKANNSTVTSHTGNTGIHVTSTEKTNWNAAKAHADKAHAPSNAQPNQNAFSNVAINGTTISADNATDTLNMVAGSNVTITPDAANDKITIAAKDTTYGVASGSANGLMSSTDKAKLDGIATGANKYVLPTGGLNVIGGVKTTSQVTSTSGYTACPIISGVPYYRDTNTTYTLGSFGVTASSAELNYCDGVTSNIQTQLNGKAPKAHSHVIAQATEPSGQNVGDIWFIEG